MGIQKLLEMKDLVPEFAIFGGMKGFQLKGSKDGLRYVTKIYAPFYSVVFDFSTLFLASRAQVQVIYTYSIRL